MSVTPRAIVEITGGKIEGIYEGGLYIFRGVPYAAPPVGRQRWLSPQPVQPWDGVRPVQQFATIAPQSQMTEEMFLPTEPEPQDEDCLYLNIWTPGLDDARRPVMVSIHGGGFNGGSGSSLVSDGCTLSRRGNAVIVTINYRLGSLGFLNLSEVTGGGIPATGNEGLLDQAFALEWVRDNIDAFGGDPDNVTVFGQSAGAMSIGALLAIPKAHGLFHKAIPQSGAAHTASSLEQAIRVAGVFLDILGVNPDDTEGLRSLPVERLMTAQQELLARSPDPRWGYSPSRQASGLGGLPFQPVIDGSVLPQLPIGAIASGSADNIPILVGSTLEEWKLFVLMDESISGLDESGLLERCRQQIPTGDVSGIIESYRKARKRHGLPTTPPELFMAIMTDKVFRMPAVRLAESHSRRHQPVYVYLFTWASPLKGGMFGACHGVDMGFLFGTFGKNPSFWGSGPEVEALAGKIQDACLAFARTGDPSCESLGRWPVFGDRRETMLLNEECTLVAAPYDEEVRAWKAIPDTVLGTF